MNLRHLQTALILYSKKKTDAVMMQWLSRKRIAGENSSPHIEKKISMVSNTFILKFKVTDFATLEFGKGAFYDNIKWQKNVKASNKAGHTVKKWTRGYFPKDKNGNVIGKFVPSGKQTLGVRTWVSKTPIGKAILESYGEKWQHRLNHPAVPRGLITEVKTYNKNKTAYLNIDLLAEKKKKPIWSHDGSFTVGKTFGISWHRKDHFAVKNGEEKNRSHYVTVAPQSEPKKNVGGKVKSAVSEITELTTAAMQKEWKMFIGEMRDKYGMKG